MGRLRVLPPPENENGTPYADVIELREVEDGRLTVWEVYVRCPYSCKKGYHVHGAGRDGKDYEGHRVAHCTSGPGVDSKGYIVRAVGDVPHVTLDDPKRKPFSTRWNKIKREERAAQRHTEENKALDRRGLEIMNTCLKRRNDILALIKAQYDDAGRMMRTFTLGHIYGTTPLVIPVELWMESFVKELQKPRNIEILTQAFSEVIGEPVNVTVRLKIMSPPDDPPSPPTSPRDPTLPPGRTKRPPTDPLQDA